MNKILRICPTSLHIDKIGRISNFSINQRTIRIELMELSQHHCMFCDCILHLSEYTPHIEHFKPKNIFPNLESTWHNLFVSCPKCNSNKGNKYPTLKPLKPDTKDYSFDYWFEINWKTYEINPNSLRSEAEKNRAKITIEWLGLNKESRPHARNEEVNRYDGSNLNDWSYRVFIERTR